MTAAEKVTTEGLPERNLVEMLIAREKTSKTPAGRVKTKDGWVDVSWTQVLERVRTLSNALVAWGLQPGDRVAVFGGTGLTWVVVDLAIAAARAICVPIYGSNTPDEARYILQNSGACLLFVDSDVPDAKQAGRLTRVREKLDECPEVRAVVVWEDKAQGGKEVTLEGFLSRHAGGGGFEERAAAIGPEELCHFIYTSGTTGDPKGVMLSHGNWAYEAQALRALGVLRTDDSMMLFLPLAHSFAQAAKSAWVSIGFTMVFAESVEKVVANLAETNPTVMPSVPRVFEKVFASVQSAALSAPGVRGTLGRWAFRLFDEYVEAREAGREYDSIGWSLAKALVFRRVRGTLDEKLGGRMRLFVSGGAPLSRKIAYFFDLLGIKVTEGYGLTETSAGATIGRPESLKIGTVGPALPGSELRIAADGEVMIRGPHIMKGYYRNESATAEVIEPDGWFHSGDIGELDSKGLLRITDRKKDIIVTAGGKNVAPQNLENSLKTFPIISQSMVYGDKRPYLTALVCVNEENARKLLQDKGITVTSYAEVIARPEVKQAVQQAFDVLNKDLPPYTTVKKFTLMDHDFSQETGELTPTLKVKRKVCTQRYWAQLDGMYEERVIG